MEGERRPYVVSDDINGLMSSWAAHNGLEVPQSGVFKSVTRDLRSQLEGIFPENVDVIDESTIRPGLEALVQSSRTPVISLDRAYVRPDLPNVEGYIDLTRGVDESFRDIGIRQRPGHETKDQQLAKLWTPTPQPVALVDDVLFTGGSLLGLAEDLALVNRPVTKVIAGIAIGDGVTRLENSGIEVTYVEKYDNVIDEVCARDFYPGVPFSGRSIFTPTGEVWSAPYIAPFGDPVVWASIPEERAQDFSQACLEQAITVWSAVEKASETKIPSSRIPRRIKGVDDERSVVYALKRHQS